MGLHWKRTWTSTRDTLLVNLGMGTEGIMKLRGNVSRLGYRSNNSHRNWDSIITQAIPHLDTALIHEL